jgi:hypothetical protein
MKNIIFLIIFTITSYFAFSQNDLPGFLVEANTGYAFGINLDNVLSVDLKLLYPINSSGINTEIGILHANSVEDLRLRFFIGPMFFFHNSSQWRSLITMGFHVSANIASIDKSFYLGLGSSVSLHRQLTRNIYAGLNLGITYVFNIIYEEIIGYNTSVITNTNTGLTSEYTYPEKKYKNHFGNNFYIKPSLLIGFQY